MKSFLEWDIRRNEGTLSVLSISLATMLIVTVLGLQTVWTHFAQIASISFQSYAWGALIIAILAIIAVGLNARKTLQMVTIKDPFILLGIIAIGLVCILISVSLRRIGRFIPDEYYYGANPVYYIQHANKTMGFELFFFYSGGEPFYSTAYLTATAFDYSLGALAYITNMEFIKIYYLVGGGLGALLIAFMIFLAISNFAKNTRSAFYGTLFTTMGIILLAETVWTPGGYSLTRAFEGKIIMLFAGIPLFIHQTLTYFTSPSKGSWLMLFLSLAMLTGMSTSSFMIFPILGCILYISIVLANREQYPSLKIFISRGFFYLSSFGYLFIYAIFVSQTDKLDTALAINVSNGYTDSVREYLLGFYNPALPITPLFLIAFTILALFLSKGKMRIFLSTWIVLVLLIVPNPLTANILLKFFRGIYFRLLYIYPFPLLIGVATALLYEHPKEEKPYLWPVLSGLFIILLFTSPSSLFVSDRYTWGGWSTYKENQAAIEIINIAPPHGVMIAPYPISGALSMIDSEYQQLITRDDHTIVYLSQQGRGEEAKLRTTASNFLDNGKIEDISAFEQLLTMYPEIQTVVFHRKFFYRKEYMQTSQAILGMMKSNGFNHRLDLESTIIFWR
jgi:hypothetical protein